MSRRLANAAAVVLVAGLYFTTAKLGLLAAVAQKVVSSAWPPAGFALAVLLLFGTRLWPGVALGAFLLNATSGVAVPGAAGIALGNTLEAVIGALLLRRTAGLDIRLERLRDVLALALVAVVATVVSATIGVTSLWASGAIARSAMPRLLVVWWSGDALGVLLVAPLLLTWASAWRRPRPWVPRRALEAVALGLALAVVTTLVLRNGLAYVYAVFPLLVWAALRFGPPGVSASAVLVACLIIGSMLRETGPSLGSTPTETLALLQLLLAVIASTGLVLAAITAERTAALQASRDSESRYRELLENAPEAILVHRDARWVFANRAAARLLRATSPAHLVGRPVFDVVHPDSQSVVRARMAQQVGDAAQVIEEKFVALDGTVLDVEVMGMQISLDGTEARQILVREVGERKRASEDLLRSESRFRAILEAAPDAMVIADDKGRIVLVNKQTENLFGYSQLELIGKQVESLLPEGLGATHRAHRTEYLRNPVWRPMGRGLELAAVRKDGSAFPVDISLSPLEIEEGTLVMAAIRDVTERKLAGDALAASRERLAALSRKLLEAHELERTRIARDLHDQVGQALTAVKLHVEAVHRATFQPGQPAPLADTIQAVEQAIDDVRALTLELRPALLDDLGLAAAITSYARRQAARAGLELGLAVSPIGAWVPKDVDIACFRILQEAVTNVIRHSAARRVDIRLEVEQGHLQLVVTDDGRGFDTRAVTTTGDAQERLGLIGMQERAELAGGALAVASQPGAGTTLRASFPLERPGPSS